MGQKNNIFKYFINFTIILLIISIFTSYAQAKMMADTIVISQVNLGAGNEMIELYNPTDKDINLNGWYLLNKSENIITFSATDTIPAFGFYSVNDGGAGGEPGAGDVTAPDAYSLTDSGDSVELFDNVNNKIDGVGWEGTTSEGASATQVTGTKETLVRKFSYAVQVSSDTLAPAFDTNDNATDFYAVTTTDSTTIQTSASSTLYYKFLVSAPSSVTVGAAFDLSCTFVNQSNTLITDYTATNAWADITVSAGSISPDTTSTFTNGVKITSATITGASGNVTITVSDAYCTGYVTVNVIGDSIDITSPTTGHDTNVTPIVVKGSTSGGVGDTVDITVNGISAGETEIYSGFWTKLNVNLNSGANSIAASLYSGGLYKVGDTITVTYYGNPTITISSPADNHDTTTQTINIVGTSTNTKAGDSVGIYVDGVYQDTFTVIDASGNWSGTATLTGSDSVAVALFDQFGRTRNDTITVNYYGNPAITITSPADNHDTNTQTIYIKGTTTNAAAGDSVGIYVDGAYQDTVTVDASGDWSGTAALTGSDSVSVALFDQFSRTRNDTITVNYYGNPTITISSPADNHDTTTQTIYIVGTTTNTKTGDSVGIYVDGVYQDTVTVDGSGNWSGTAAMTGSDSVSAALFDHFGRTRNDTITVNYSLLPGTFSGLYVEDFESRNEGQTAAADSWLTSGFTANNPPNDTFSVQNISSNNLFKATGLDVPCTWVIDPALNISGYTDVACTIQIAEAGTQNASDYIMGYYQIDNGALINFFDQHDDMATGTTLTDTYVQGLKGENIKIYIVAYNASTSKDWRFDNVQITGVWAGDTIVISSPESHDTSVSPITIVGTSSGKSPDTVGIIVNGSLSASNTITNGNWTVAGVNLNNGANTVAAVYYDAGVYTEADTINITYYASPTITISTPTDNHDTNANTIWVTGTTTNTQSGDSVGIYVDGVYQDTFSVAADGTWSGTATLTGSDSVSVALFDHFDRTRNDTITVNYYGNPAITITSPADNHDTNTQTIYIKGTTTNAASGDSVGIYVDGAYQDTVTVDASGDWSGTATLTGSDSVSVALFDQFSRTRNDTITVNYLGTPSVSITFPTDNYETGTQIITITGTSTNTSAGDSVGIYVDGVYQDTVSVAADGTWSGTAALTGSDSVSAALFDKFGVTKNDTISVHYLKADLLISEISPYGDGGSADWLEIYVKTGGYIPTGYHIYNNAANLNIDGITAKLSAGEYIIIHDVAGTSETTDKTSSVDADAGAGYWDIYTTSLNLLGADDIAFLRDKDNNILDAVCWADFDGTLDKSADIANAVAAGQWGRFATADTEFDNIPSNISASTPRLIIRGDTVNEYNNKYDYDFINGASISATMGANNDITNFNADTGTGSADIDPSSVFQGSNQVFKITYTSAASFKSGGPSGFIVVSIPQGYPQPSKSSSDSGYFTLSGEVGNVGDSYVLNNTAGETFIVLCIDFGFTAGETIAIHYGSTASGGIDVPAGAGTDTFVVLVDPTGSNVDTAAQLSVVRKAVSSIVVTPASAENYKSTIDDLTFTAYDDVSNPLSGVPLAFMITQDPAGGDVPVYSDTSPSDGITDNNGQVTIKLHTDTTIAGANSLWGYWTGDNTIGDTFTDTTTANPFSDTLVINEFIPNPNTLDHDNNADFTDAEEEFIEIYNPTSAAVSVLNWQLGEPGSVTTLPAVSIPAYGYLVLYNDNDLYVLKPDRTIQTATTAAATPWSLLNSADTVILIDPGANTIDIKNYTSITDDKSWSRKVNGWATGDPWVGASDYSPGITGDVATQNGPSNSFIKIGVPSAAQPGSGFTMSDTIIAGDSSVVDDFSLTCNLYVSAGTITPATIDFTAGYFDGSCTITGAFGPVIITISETSTNTSGTIAMTMGFDVNDDSSLVEGSNATADGSDSALIIVTSFDSNGAPNANDTVLITTDFGTIVGSDTGTTNDSGYVYFYVKSSSEGTATIRAYVYTTSTDSVLLTDSAYCHFITTSGFDADANGVLNTSISGVSDISSGLKMFSVISPDGTKIAYYNSSDSAIYVMNSNGGGVTKVSNSVMAPSNLTQLSWANFGGVDYVVFCNLDYTEDDFPDAGAPYGVHRVKPYAVPADGDAASNHDTELHQYKLYPWGYNTNVQYVDVLYDSDLVLVSENGNLRYFNGEVLFGNTDQYGDEIFTTVTKLFKNLSGTPKSDKESFCCYPRWSQSGKISFVRVDVNTWTQSEIWVKTDTTTVTDWDSSTLIRISPAFDGNFYWSPAWNRSGDVIAYSKDEAGNFNFQTWRNNGFTAAFSAGSNFDQYMQYFNPDSTVASTGLLRDGSTGTVTAMDTTSYPAQVIASSADDEWELQWSQSGAAFMTAMLQSSDDANAKMRKYTLSNQTTVESSGGILFEDGKFIAHVPAGDTLATGTVISVSQPTAPPAQAYDTLLQTSVARDFYPDSAQFSNPVTIVFHYTAADLANPADDGSNREVLMQIYWYNPSSSKWEKIGGIVDPDNNTITFTTTHFSSYRAFLEAIPDSSLSTITSSDTVSKADLIDSVPVTVTLKYFTDDPMEDVPVTITTSRPSDDVIQRQSYKTDANGQILFYVQSAEEGTRVISVTNLGSNFIDTLLIKFEKPDILYVNQTDGSDTSGIGTEGYPFKTISKAMSEIGEYDTIIIKQGVYSETIEIKNNYVTIIGEDTSNTIIKLNSDTSSSDKIIIKAENVTNLSIENLTIQSAYNAVDLNNCQDIELKNMNISSCYNAGINLNQISDVKIYNLQIENTMDAIAALNSDNNYFYENILENNDTHILLNNSTINNIRGNILSNSKCGIEIDSSIDNSIKQNTFNNITEYSIKSINNSSNNVIEKNNLNLLKVYSDIINETSSFVRNYWATTDNTSISSLIEGIGSDSIQFIPFRRSSINTESSGDTVSPLAPIFISTESALKGVIKIKWDKPNKNEEYNMELSDLAGYRIYRAETTNPDNWGSAIADVGADVLNYNDFDIEPNKTYYYTITAYDNASPSNESYYTLINFSASTELIGDITDDNKIDIEDLSEIGKYFGASADVFPAFDLDEDGKIDIDDIKLFLQHKK